MKTAFGENTNVNYVGNDGLSNTGWCKYGLTIWLRHAVVMPLVASYLVKKMLQIKIMLRVLHV